MSVQLRSSRLPVFGDALRCSACDKDCLRHGRVIVHQPYGFIAEFQCEGCNVLSELTVVLNQSRTVINWR